MARPSATAKLLVTISVPHTSYCSLRTCVRLNSWYLTAIYFTLIRNRSCCVTFHRSFLMTDTTRTYCDNGAHVWHVYSRQTQQQQPRTV